MICLVDILCFYIGTDPEAQSRQLFFVLVIEFPCPFHVVVHCGAAIVLATDPEEVFRCRASMPENHDSSASFLFESNETGFLAIQLSSDLDIVGPNQFCSDC